MVMLFLGNFLKTLPLLPAADILFVFKRLMYYYKSRTAGRTCVCQFTPEMASFWGYEAPPQSPRTPWGLHVGGGTQERVSSLGCLPWYT